MKIKNILKILIVLVLIQILPTMAQTMSMCKSVAAELNKTLPIKKDRLTTIRETGCVPGKPKNTFLYVLEVDASLADMQALNLKKDIKPNVLNTFCTDPKVRPVLEAYDVDNRYFTLKGEFAGSFLMTAKECK
jgi:hypothetical protein